MEYPDQMPTAQGEQPIRAALPARRARSLRQADLALTGAEGELAFTAYDSRVYLMSGLLASSIGSVIAPGCFPARSTMPADLFTPTGYRRMNADQLGIP